MPTIFIMSFMLGMGASGSGPSAVELTALGVFTVPRFSAQSAVQRSIGGKAIAQPRFSGQVVTER